MAVQVSQFETKQPGLGATPGMLVIGTFVGLFWVTWQKEPIGAALLVNKDGEIQAVQAVALVQALHPQEQGTHLGAAPELSRKEPAGQLATQIPLKGMNVAVQVVQELGPEHVSQLAGQGTQVPVAVLNVLAGQTVFNVVLAIH